jgi:hypothetical protein
LYCFAALSCPHTAPRLSFSILSIPKYHLSRDLLIHQQFYNIATRPSNPIPKAPTCALSLSPAPSLLVAEAALSVALLIPELSSLATELAAEEIEEAGEEAEEAAPEVTVALPVFEAEPEPVAVAVAVPEAEQPAAVGCNEDISLGCVLSYLEISKHTKLVTPAGAQIPRAYSRVAS